MAGLGVCYRLHAVRQADGYTAPRRHRVPRGTEAAHGENGAGEGCSGPVEDKVAHVLVGRATYRDRGHRLSIDVGVIRPYLVYRQALPRFEGVGIGYLQAINCYPLACR